MEARKSPSLTDRSTETTVSILNGVCRTNLFRRERSITRCQQPPSPFPPGNDNCRSRDPDRGRFPRHPWTTTSRPPGARPVIKEILPSTSETISGCERESRKRMRYLSRKTDSTQESAPMRRQTTPHLQQRRDPARRTFFRPLFVCHQSDRSRWRLPKRVPYPCDPSSSDPAGKRKRRVLSKPAAATEEPRVKHRHGQQRRQMKTLPWTVQTKISEESSEDAMSATQECRSKQCASWSGQNQARKREKYQETREGQHNVSGRPLQPDP